jgi:hypothetical protein
MLSCLITLAAVTDLVTTTIIYEGHSDNYVMSHKNLMVSGENLYFTTNILQASTLHARWQGCNSLKMEGDIDVCMKQCTLSS